VQAGGLDRLRHGRESLTVGCSGRHRPAAQPTAASDSGEDTHPIVLPMDARPEAERHDQEDGRIQGQDENQEELRLDISIVSLTL
jgi:hypothetical protein